MGKSTYASHACQAGQQHCADSCVCPAASPGSERYLSKARPHHHRIGDPRRQLISLGIETDDNIFFGVQPH
eukprot:794106-Pelagomonas_calceolata.AAC.1